MKKLYSSIVIGTVMMLAILSSCGKGPNLEPPKDICVAVIGGTHDNLASIEMPIIEISDSVEKKVFITSNDRIQVFFGMVADSNPTKHEYDYSDMYEKDKNNKRWDTVRNEVVKKIKSTMNYTAEDEEVDTLKALYNTAVICNQRVVDKNQILVFDSGLCTSGALNFIKKTDLKKMISDDSDISEEEVNRVIENLERKKEIKPFNAATEVTWYGIGMTGGKQSELSKLQISNLKKLWKGILNKTGAQVNFVDVINSDQKIEYDELPNVSVVLFDEAIQLGEDELGFKPGSEEFLENTEDKRNRLLEKFVNEAKENRILIVGTTSSGGSRTPDNEDFELSWKRVDAVKEELIKLGVSEYQVKTLGLGTQSHKYDPGEYVNGEYNQYSPAAISNRSVYIMLDDSLDAKEFYSDQSKLSKLKDSGIKIDR